MSCATALAAAVGNPTEFPTGFTGPADEAETGTLTVVATSLVVTGFVAYGPNTPDAHGAHLDDPIIEVYAGDTGGSTSSFEHPTWCVGYEVGVAAGGYSAGATWRSGNGTGNAAAFAIAAIPTLATSPIQESHGKFPSSTAGKRTLPGVPTEGSAIVMVVTRRNAAPYTTADLFPNDGNWVELQTAYAEHSPGVGDSIGIYARCVQAGDGSQYGISAGGQSHSVTIMEWEILVAPPPPPIVPDVEFSVDGVKFDNLMEARVRFELNAAGSGYMVLSKGDPQAIPTMLYRGAIVQCTFPEIHSEPIFEFFLEEGDFDVISGEEEGGEELRFGGPGTLSILKRAIVRSQEYLGGIGYPKPNKGVWVFDESNTEGHIINKLLREAQASDRPAHPLAGLTWGFDADNDSNGQSWHDQELEGKWRVKIGTNYYDAILRLVNSGLLYIEMYPGLVLYARRTTGTDRTTGAYATGKVRFVKNENIANELTKSLAGQHFATHAEVKYVDNDDDIHYINATKDAGDFSYDKEVYIESEASHANTARRQAKAAMKLREDLQDAIELAHKVPWPGKVDGSPSSADIVDNADELNGWYLPGPAFADHGSYWLGDVITLHTGLESEGASDFEWQNRHKRVYAITLQMDATGHLAPPIVELNAPKARRSGVLQGISGTLSATGIGGSTGGSHGIPTIVDGTGYQPIAEKGDPDGYPGLDGDGHVPADQLGEGSTGDGVLVLTDNGTWRPILGRVKDVNPATGTQTPDVALNEVYLYTLSGNITIAEPLHPLDAGMKSELTFVIYHDGTHGVSAWPASFEWSDTDGTPTATPPSLYTVAGARSVVTAISYDGGVTYGASLDNALSSGGGGNVEVDEDGAPVVGTATALDFRHGLDVTAPGGGVARVAVDEGELTYGSTAAAIGTSAGGSAGTPSHSDHVHATGAGTPSTQAFGDSASTGTGPAAAMTDHKHAMPANPVTAHEAASDPHTGYVLESLLDAKGDLIAASADNTPAKVTVGADDTILMADSGQTAGLKWVAAGTPSTQAFGDSAAAGTADTYTRGDHKHAMPANPTVGLTMLLSFRFDGGGSAIPVGAKCYLPNLIAGTITRVTAVCDTGTITIEFKKSSYSGFAGSLTSITGSAGIAISSGQKAFDATLSGWTTSISDDDVIEGSVTAVSGATKATGVLRVTRT